MPFEACEFGPVFRGDLPGGTSPLVFNITVGYLCSLRKQSYLLSPPMGVSHLDAEPNIRGLVQYGSVDGPFLNGEMGFTE